MKSDFITASWLSVSPNTNTHIAAPVPFVTSLSITLRKLTDQIIKPILLHAGNEPTLMFLQSPFVPRS